MSERKSDTEILKDLKNFQSSLALVKQNYEPVIDELIEFCNHTRRQIDDTNKGTVTGKNVYDGTANSANKIQADGFFGNLCSQSLRWFSESLPNKYDFPRWSNMRKWSGKRLDDIPEVKAWLEACDDVLYSAFLRSNFYDEQPVFYRDGGSVGCANKYVEEDVKKGRLVVTTLHPREYVVAVDAMGNVDTEFRTYKLTLKQLREKFGEDTLKEDIPAFDQSFERNPYDEREIVHAVLSRSDYDPAKKDNKNKPWASFWYFPGGKKILLESGFEHFPFIHWQFNKGNDGYGYGPGHEAYVDIMLANQQAQSNLIAGQKMVEPPMVVHNNLRGMVQVGPKGRTYVTDMNTMRPAPLMEDIKLPYALEMLERTEKIIRERWHVDFFLMLSRLALENRNITATQVMEMMGEKATMLGTVIGRIANDELNPMIDLFFYAEQAAGRIPPMPQIMLDSGLTNANIEIDYTGPLAMAQKRAHATQGIRQGLATVGEIIPLFPQARHKVKLGQTLDKLLISIGFPASCLTSEDEFNAAVETENKQMQEAQAMEQMKSIGSALPGMGKAIEPNSPAEMLVEGMGGKLKGQEGAQ